MTNINSLKTLVVSLNTIIINNNISLHHTIPYISSYCGNDWKHTVVDINKRSYVKHLIYGNCFYELFLISWNDTSSKWHSHPANGCVMKVLSGNLHEYTHFNGIINYRMLNENNIGFKRCDALHNIISNGINHSLHLYSPVGYRLKKYLT